MEIKKETITPEWAAEALSTMGKNRHLNPRRVDALTKAIRNGEYTLTNDLICFNEEGKLINGQHRLTAVCEAGIPICAYVAYNVPEESVIDRGLPRAMGDSLYMRGLIDKELSTTNRVALVNAFFKSCGGKFLYLTDDEKAAFMNHYEDEIVTTDALQRTGPKNGVCRRSGVGAGILSALIMGISREKLSRFAECVNTGYITNDAESSAVTLRNWLIETTGISGGTASDMQASSTEQAIRDFVKGKARHVKYSKIIHVYIKPWVESVSR